MRTNEYTGDEIQDLKSILNKHQYTIRRTPEKYEYKEINSSFTTYLLDQINEDIEVEALEDIDHITETSESVKSILYSEEMQRTVWEYGTTEIHTEEYKQQAGESLEDAIYRTWANLDEVNENIYLDFVTYAEKARRKQLEEGIYCELLDELEECRKYYERNEQEYTYKLFA